MSIFVVPNPNPITTVLKQFGTLKLSNLSKNRQMSSTIAFSNLLFEKRIHKISMNACVLSLTRQVSPLLFCEYTLSSNLVTTAL